VLVTRTVAAGVRSRPARPRYLVNRNPNVHIVQQSGGGEGGGILGDYPVPPHTLEAIQVLWPPTHTYAHTCMHSHTCSVLLSDLVRVQLYRLKEEQTRMGMRAGVGGGSGGDGGGGPAFSSVMHAAGAPAMRLMRSQVSV
jgi:hypothetical protein